MWGGAGSNRGERSAVSGAGVRMDRSRITEDLRDAEIAAMPPRMDIPGSFLPARFLTLWVSVRKLPPMTMLELKQQVSRLTTRERRELNAYLIRLRHESPQWRRTAGKRLQAMDAGRKVTASELDRRLQDA
jgi:hypothetical protein